MLGADRHGPIAGGHGAGEPIPPAWAEQGDLPPTYGHFIMVEPLLQLQKQISPGDEASPDELIFIIVHQVSELWFKQLLHDLELVREAMVSGEFHDANRLFRRSSQVVSIIDRGFSLLETMPAHSYILFRDHLVTGSGFQSAQFRELEILLGCHRPFTLDQEAFTEDERRRLAERLAAPNLWDAFRAAMERHGYEVPAREEARRDTDAALQVREELRRMYLSGQPPLLRELSEEMVHFDGVLSAWRFHHALMAERAIGRKIGTGGEGVEYLYKSARIQAFPELWGIRSDI